MVPDRRNYSLLLITVFIHRSPSVCTERLFPAPSHSRRAPFGLSWPHPAVTGVPITVCPGSVVGPRDGAESQHTAPSPACPAGSSAGLGEDFGCCSLGHRDGRGFGLRPGSEPQLYHFLALWPRADFSSGLTATISADEGDQTYLTELQECHREPGRAGFPARPLPWPGDARGADRSLPPRCHQQVASLYFNSLKSRVPFF